MLRQDKELEDYMTSNSILFKEIKFRDKSFKEGKLHLTTQEELFLRLKMGWDEL